MRIETAIGRQIARLRQARQMSLTQLGEAMGEYLDKPWSRQAVHQAERGRRAFTAAEMAALALALDTSVPALFLTDAAPIELPRAAAPANEGRVADVLIDLEKRGWEAVKTKDAATLRRLLAEEYVAITSDGTRLTWSELLLAFPFFELKSHELSGFRVIPLGIDAAIVTYEAKSETDIFGVSVKERTQISSTWVRRKSEWRNVFYQETTVDD